MGAEGAGQRGDRGADRAPSSRSLHYGDDGGAGAAVAAHRSARRMGDARRRGGRVPVPRVAARALRDGRQPRWSTAAASGPRFSRSREAIRTI